MVCPKGLRLDLFIFEVFFEKKQIKKNLRQSELICVPYKLK
ncbi:hypothetical protein D1AOALGA4SA_91 [Olavius algarvensis Delta 1 endosymbiont]|nr:hypothetical protein D1AOALGA4SA_91 [Olavius algarvensis Delta 1 endosymbiont]